MTAAARLSPTLLAVLVLAGCGASRSRPVVPAPLGRSLSGAAPKRSLVTAAPAPTGDPPPERGGTIARAAAAAELAVAPTTLAPSPSVALRRYALAYVNWSASGLPARERQLAGIAVGAARLAAQQTAAAAGGAAALAADHVANHGAVVAIAAGEGVDRGRWVIVTEEQTTGSGPYAGLPPGPHVTLAQVARLPGGWAVSVWLPLS